VPKVGLGVLLIASLGIFVGFLARTTEKDAAQVLVLAPTADSVRPIDDSFLKELDVPALMAASRAEWFEQAMREGSPRSMVSRVSISNLRRSWEEFRSSLIHKRHRQQTLVVYVSGILSVSQQEPSLCDNSPQAIGADAVLSIRKLLELLQQTQHRQVLLCLEVHVSQSATANATSAIAWKHLVECIETQLVQDSCKPIAVNFHLRSAVDRSSASEAVRFAEELRNQLSVNRDAIQAVRIAYDQTTELSQDSELASDWMVSATWPIDSNLDLVPGRESQGNKIRLISTPLVSDSGVTEVATQAASASEQKSSVGVASVRNMEPDVRAGWIKGASLDQLLEWTGQTLHDWRTRRTTPSIPLVSLPQAASFQDRNPLVYQSLREIQSRLDWLQQWSPASLNISAVRIYASVVLSVDSKRRGLADTSGLFQSLPVATATAIDSPTDSLVANVTLNLLGILEYDDSERDTQALSELMALLVYGQSDVETKAWLEKQRKERDLGCELAYASSILSQPGVPWSLARSLILARVLSERIAVDPLTDEWCRDALQQADSLRLKAERGCRDQFAAGWIDKAESELREAHELFHESLDRLERVRSQSDSYAHLARRATAFGAQTREAFLGPPFASSDEIDMELSGASDRLFSLIAPWNRPLACQWVDTIAIQKSKLLEASNSTKEFGPAVRQFEQSQQEMIERLQHWVLKDAPSIPKQSPFWEFVQSIWTMPFSDLVTRVARSEETLSKVLKTKVTQVNSEFVGSNSVECNVIKARLAHWSTLHSRYQPSHIAHSIPDLEWICDPTLRLTLQASTMINPMLRTSDLKQPIRLSVEFDEEDIDVRWDQHSLRSGNEWQISAPQRSMLAVPFSVHKKREWTKSKSIRLTAKQGDAAQRVLVGLQDSQAPIAKLQWNNRSLVQKNRTTDRGGGGQSDLHTSTLIANQSNELELRVTNLTGDVSNLTCTLYVLPTPTQTIPTGGISQAEAKQWKESFAGLTLVGIANPIVVDPGQSAPLIFPAKPWLPDALPLLTEHVILEVKNEGRDLVQLLDWRPRILHPRQYVSVGARVDAARGTLQADVALLDDSPISQNGVLVEIQLLAREDLRLIAKSQVHLMPNSLHSSKASRLLSTANSTGNAALLCISVDGWPSSFLMDVDLNQSGDCVLSKTFTAVRVTSAESNDVIPKDQPSVKVMVHALLNDECFNPRDDFLYVGWDMLGNRVLQDDSSLILQSPVSVQTFWNGIGERGNPGLYTVVQPYTVALKAPSEWDRPICAMAELHQGEKLAYSNPQPFVFDRVAPRVASLRLLNQQPIALGKPLQAEVQIQDDGLSEVVMVEGAWSLSGELDFYEKLTAQPAVYRDRERWILTLPTDMLPSGKSTLLVRARDRAGNIGSTYNSVIELLSEAEIALRSASLRTDVQGIILRKGLPLQGMRVRLQSIPKTEENAANAKPVEQGDRGEVNATAVTSADGRFALSAVPSGTYQVEATGIVRGMRETHTQQVTVDAARGPLQMTIRMETKP
jgi:hypothetical protein